jgi:hypothetical protein
MNRSISVKISREYVVMMILFGPLWTIQATFSCFVLFLLFFCSWPFVIIITAWLIGDKDYTSIRIHDFSFSLSQEPTHPIGSFCITFRRSIYI